MVVSSVTRRRRQTERDGIGLPNLAAVRRRALAAWRLRCPLVGCLLLAIAVPVHVCAGEAKAAVWTSGGYIKYRSLLTQAPVDSVFRDISGEYLAAQQLESRLKIAARRGRWDFDAQAQLLASRADDLGGAAAGLPALSAGAVLPNDRRRWFDLTRRFSSGGRNTALLRLDRASVGYTGDRVVMRFGRQAISWGNGLLFTPMDIFNPFDPAAIDREYKNGDDMLYLQWLQANGNDVQAVGVMRRDPANGRVSRGQSSVAFKYHGLWRSNEYDLLLAEHYDDRVVGVGFSAGAAGAVWRSDLVWTDTRQRTVFSATAGVTWSWAARQRNWTGVLEYFYNGFGRGDGDYRVDTLESRPALMQRLERGELFNLGRHYLGASINIELSPLLNAGPNVFINLEDPSALGQLVARYDWLQNVQLIAALSVPIGPAGTEFGGPASGDQDKFLSAGPSLFAQLAWYF